MNPAQSMGAVLVALPLASFWILELPLISVTEGGRWQLDARPAVVLAQAIAPASDGTGTTVIPNGSRYSIEGGSLSSDGANLFHSFTRFGLESGQTATFVSNPAIQNILARIVGGDRSLINGLIQVTGGNSNLFLMNPAGIIFGRDARLDVPGSFFATTASGIGLSDRWFNAVGANDYSNLVGTPSAFYFPSVPGSIINAGLLAVRPGQTLTLLGQTAINTGQLQTKGGTIAIAAVPGEKLVRISQEGHLLNLEIAPPAGGGNTTPNALPRTPLSLPQLLTGIAPQALGLTINGEGQVVLTATNQRLPTESGTAIASGTVDASSTSPEKGGNIYILGDRVGLLNANLNVSGNNGGGQVFIGGDYRGATTLPAASRTYIDRNSTIAADALSQGDGGRISVGAKVATGFFGSISARGRSETGGAGAGGSVEISGRERLIFDGKVQLTGANGTVGTLVLARANITISDTPNHTDDASFFNSSTTSGTGSPSEFTISAKALESTASTAEVVLEATNDIKLENLPNNQLKLQSTTGSITFKADADGDGNGSFSMKADDSLTTSGGAVAISGATVTTGSITTNGGNITLSSHNNLTSGNLSASNSQGVGGNITLSADLGSITAGLLSANSITTAGAISVTAGNSSIKTSAVSAEGILGGNITFSAFADINAPQISAAGKISGGEISFTSQAGAILIPDRPQLPSPSDLPAISAAATSGSAGNITLNARGNLRVGAIDARGQVVGGNISLTGGRGVSTGAIATSLGNITVTGDQIDFLGGNNSVSGKGALVLQPASDSQNINIGNRSQPGFSAGGLSEGPNALNLRVEDLAALQHGFSGITIGRPTSSGAIAIADGVTFKDPVTIQAPVGSGAIVQTGNWEEAIVSRSPFLLPSSVTLIANGDITVGNLSTSGADIRLTSNQGNISAGTLTSAAGVGNSGSIQLNAIGNIAVNAILTTAVKAEASSRSAAATTPSGNLSAPTPSVKGGDVSLTSTSGNITVTRGIDTSAVAGTAGNITLGASGAIAVANLNASGLQGGTVKLTATDSITVGAVAARGTQTGGDITLTSNEIDLTGGANSVSSNGNLLLQPATPRQDIAIAGAGNTPALDLTASDLATLQNGFATITIGRADGSGTITILGEGRTVTFSDPTLIQAPAASGMIVHSGGKIAGTDDGRVAIAAGEIRVGDITSTAGITLSSSHGNVVAGTLAAGNQTGAAGAISIQSAGSVQLGNVNANGSQSGGDIRIVAGDSIRAGSIDSGSKSGNAGASTLTAPNNIEVVAVKATGGGSGGNVAITAGGLFRATGTFTDPHQVNASISTAGAKSAGSLTIRHGDGTCASAPCTPTPFTVGNPNRNGTAGAITDGQYTVENRSVSGNFDLKAVGSPQKSTSSSTGTSATAVKNSTNGGQGTGNATATALNATVDGASSTVPNPTTASNSPIRSEGELLGPADQSTQGLPMQTLTVTPVPSTSSTVASRLGNSTVQTGNGSQSTQISPNLTVASTPQNPSAASTPRNSLTPAPEATGYIAPESARSNLLNQVNSVEMVLQIEQHRGREYENYFGGNLAEKRLTAANIKETLSSIARVTGVKPAIVYVSAGPSQLELRLFLPEGKPIFKSIPVSREVVLQWVREFTNEVRNPRRLNSDIYLSSAQQLYNWLIAPLAAELQEQGVGTLLFSMDSGLRTLPLAALHDGSHFLVEKYSLGLIPSLSLTDTHYVDIRDSQVLAMGASEFPPESDQNPLPAVPMELSAIVGNLWSGQSFLNENFTLDNLKAQRRQPQFRIIHLATHGEFQPGGASNSYIQFWDAKLHLDELRQLKLNDPPVELLVLSACSTAVGDEEAELGFAGLAVQAGVKSALASLWLVSDAGTLGLMAEFYQQLRTAPIKAEALRRAQLAMLRGQVHLQDGNLFYSGSRQGMPLPVGMAGRGDKNLSHPYFWAAFTMIGSPW